MNIYKQLLDEVEHDSENYQGRGLDNFAIMRKPNPIIVLLYNYKCTSVETFHRLDFRRSLVSGLRSSPKRDGWTRERPSMSVTSSKKKLIYAFSGVISQIFARKSNMRRLFV